MRHRAKLHKLGRTRGPRAALLRAQATSLLKKGRLVTTTAKAKAVRPVVERLVARARVDSLAARRQAARTIYEPKVVDKLFTDYGPKFAARPGGYLRLIKVGRRLGDAAPLTMVEFVE